MNAFWNFVVNLKILCIFFFGLYQTSPKIIFTLYFCQTGSTMLTLQQNLRSQHLLITRGNFLTLIPGNSTPIERVCIARTHTHTQAFRSNLIKTFIVIVIFLFLLFHVHSCYLKDYQVRATFDPSLAIYANIYQKCLITAIMVTNIEFLPSV